MLLAVGLLIGLNFGAMLGTFGSGAVAVGTVFVALTLVAGYVLGGPTPGTRAVLAVGTGQRNVAARWSSRRRTFTDEPGVVVMLLVTTLAGLVILVVAARRFARLSSRNASQTGPDSRVSPQVGVIPEEIMR